MYTLLRRELPTAMLVSVGHRSTLNAHHTQRLELLGDARWRVDVLAPQASARPPEAD
jgi:putative ATP-binding cassette transporter